MLVLQDYFVLAENRALLKLLCRELAEVAELVIGILIVSISE